MNMLNWIKIAGKVNKVLPLKAILIDRIRRIRIDLNLELIKPHFNDKMEKQ